jgi:excisionase family DNA binding protein
MEALLNDRQVAVRKLVRAYDVGRLLGYSTATIKRWAREGKLPGAVFIGRHIRFDPNVVEAFVRAGGKRPEQKLRGASGELAPGKDSDSRGREQYKPTHTWPASQHRH